jgi:excisionase family DNA binding protein
MLTEVHEHEALMRVQEVARELGQHPATVYRKVASGEIPSVRLGPGRAAIRVPRDEFKRWLHAPDQPRAVERLTAPPKPAANGETFTDRGSPRSGLEEAITFDPPQPVKTKISK